MTSTLTRPVRTTPQPLVQRATVCAVVPLYNYAHYVDACLASVLSQDGVDVSVIVLDDKSTDDSLSVVSNIAAHDPRVTVIANSSNRGHIPTVNTGVGLVDAEYFVKLDADDMLTPGSLARSVALLQAHPNVGFAYGFPLFFTSESPVVPARKVRDWRIWPGQEWTEKLCTRGINRIAQPEAVIRTSAFREAGMYREELPHTSDFEMWLRLAAISDVGRINGPYQGCYRNHSESMSRTVHGGILRDIVERRRAFDSFFASSPQVDAIRLQRIAHRTLAKEALGYAISYVARREAAEDPIDDFAKFALDTWPEAQRSTQWRALRRIRGMTESRVRVDPAVVARDRLRKLAFAVRWHRWRRSGV